MFVWVRRGQCVCCEGSGWAAERKGLGAYSLGLGERDK